MAAKPTRQKKPESPAIARMERLLTLPAETRHETRSCVQCSQPYEATVLFYEGCAEDFSTKHCPECRRSKIENLRREEAMTHLEGIRQERREIWRRQAGVDSLFRGKSFEGFRQALQPKAFAALNGWDGRSLVLCSPDAYGVGKTHLAAALANRLIETTETARLANNGYDILAERCPVLFVTESRMLARIRDTFNKAEDGPALETEEAIYRHLTTVALLIIDDVGKVRPGKLDFLQGVYFRVIDDRYTHGLPVILTTNLSLPELENHLGGATADRLREMCDDSGIIKMQGQSQRRLR